MAQPSSASSFDLTDPSGVIGIAFTDPPGALLSLRSPVRGTTALAEWLVGPGLELLRQRFPSAPDLRVVLDMTEMTGRSATASALLVQHARPLAGYLEHVALVPSRHLGPAYLKVVEAIAVLVRLAGVPVSIEPSAERALSKLGLRRIAERDHGQSDAHGSTAQVPHAAPNTP